jgi:hypothetical protein
MLVLKANFFIKNLLEGTYKNGAELKFVMDKNKNYVVNTAVIDDPNFEIIKTELEQLPLIEYIPLIIND